MGSYSDEQRQIGYYENHRDEYEYKVTEIKRFLNIPILFVKQNKQNYRKYDLFNCITVWKEFNAEGFDDVN